MTTEGRVQSCPCGCGKSVQDFLHLLDEPRFDRVEQSQPGRWWRRLYAVLAWTPMHKTRRRVLRRWERSSR